MQTTIPTLGPISWGRRLLPATIALGLVLLLVFGFAQTAVAQSASAASTNGPLTFGNNFFVTGDYVVAGAQGLNASFGSDGLGTGIISIPDGNPGIRGTTTVPRGANIVAALLYWQTVEKVGVMPGQPGSGQNGFFGPVFNKVPQLYAISGQNLPSQTATSFSNGGCSGTSTGKLVRTYRADVRGFLPLDADGNVLVDSADGVTFEVRLPNVGNNTPLTLGATLVLIYRVLSSPDPQNPLFVPLNVITIYDGAFAPNATPNFTMSQLIQGFYQAASSPVSRLTHIVGAGKSNKFQTAYLSGGQGGPNSLRTATPLPSPYGNGQPAFPGWYGNWDNTTWMFPDAKLNLPKNPLQENDDSAAATVVAGGGNPGCVSWGAVILSTTVHDDSRDGIPPVWKNANLPGYTDVATGQFVSLADPNDPPATGQQDIFIQMDHVVDVDSNGRHDFTPPPAAISMVQSAFRSNNIHLHITHGNPLVPGSDVIQEPVCTDKPFNLPLPYYCPYINQVGVTAWRYGFEFIKNQGFVNNQPVDEKTCESATNPPCLRRFPIAQRNSHHYVVIGDTLGAANWTFFAGKLTDLTGATIPGSGIVKQVNNTVTIYTLYGHGLTVDNANHTLPNGRVTISNAITNPNLNGTFFVTSVTCHPNSAGKPCDLTNTAPGPYSFTIQIPGNQVTANYTMKTDPYLAVFSGQATSGSGLSDVGGTGTLVTLGKWGANATLSAYAGTLMHELGHTLGLSLHGGSYYDKFAPGQALPDYRPAIEPNCKSNYQSVMNYMFQARLLGASVYSISQTSLTKNVATYFFTLVSGSLPQVGQNVNVSGTRNGRNGIFNVVNAAITSVTANTFTVSIQAPDVSLGAESNANATMISTLDFSRQQLSTLDENHLLGSPITTTDPQIAFHTTDWYDTKQTLVTDKNGNKVPLGATATHHCGDTPLNANDVKNPSYFYSGGTSALYSPAITIPWSSNTLDANFDGTQPGSEAPFRGYNDWANVDPRQTGGTGSSLLGPGGLLTGSGGLFGGPGGLFGGPGGLFGGPGGLFGGPGGLFGGPGGLFGGPGELDFANAISVTPPPTGLSASEGVSPRTITLTWTEPNFPATDHNNIYRDSHDGNGFVFLTFVAGTAPGTQNTFTDTVTCNPNGFSYFVTEVVNVNPNVNPPQFQESTQSNTVSTGQSGELLTGCYTPGSPLFASPGANSSPLAGNDVTVQWAVLDASNKAGTSANNPGSNSLFAIGPISNDVACISSTVNPPVNTPRTAISAAGGIMFDGTSQFSFKWKTAQGFNGTAAAFPPGCYRLELDLDSGQPTSGNLPASAFQVQFFLSDMNESVVITTTSPLPDAIVGVPYSPTTLQETGGVPLLHWTNSGSLPPSFALDPASGTISGTTLTAGTYNFTAQVTDSIGDFGTQPLTLTVHIFVSTSQPPPFNATTTLLPNAVVGSLYNNTVYQSGGVSDEFKAFTWTIKPGSLTLNGSPALDGSLGISFQPNTVAGGNNGTLSGTPTTAGIYTFNAMVTDSAGNTGTQTLTLNVVNALFGDLIVADPSPSSGTLFRITPDGTVIASIASILNGQPKGVAVDANTGNIYAAVTGTPSVVKVTRLGVVSTLTSGPPLINPVAVAISSSGNVYIGDNNTDKIYKFDTTANTITPFASLPNSPNTREEIRAGFDTTGNLIVATDTVNDVTGTVEVDKIDSLGNVTVLYANPTLTYSLTAANAASSGTTTYNGTFSPTIPANSVITISGFTTSANNGQFTVVSCTGTTLVVNNSAGVAETNPGTAAFQLTPASGPVTVTDSLTAAGTASSGTTTYTGSFSPTIPANSVVTISGFTTSANNGQFTVVSCTGTTLVVNNSAGVAETNPATVAFQLTAPIGTIGGIVVLSDGSIDVADFAAQSIFKIMNPGTPSMAITTLINGPAIGVTALCCTISGMANPPSQQPNTTNLFLTLNGVSSPLPSRLQLAVPEMNTVTTIVTGTAAAASVTAAGNASGGTTTYFGNFSPTIPANSLVTITGFANVANNGQFVVVSCTGAQLVVNNPNGVAETPTNPGSAIFTLVFANDVAWYTAQ